MKMRIYYEDTDAQGVVYHSNYLNFCERARSEIFFARKIGIFDPISGHFLLKSANCSFIKAAKLGDIIEIKTKCLGIKNASIHLCQEIYKDETLLFRVELTLAYLKEGRIARMDVELKKLLKDLF